jgi:hypothetical protein
MDDWGISFQTRLRTSLASDFTATAFLLVKYITNTFITVLYYLYIQLLYCGIYFVPNAAGKHVKVYKRIPNELNWIELNYLTTWSGPVSHGSPYLHSGWVGDTGRGPLNLLALATYPPGCKHHHHVTQRCPLFPTIPSWSLLTLCLLRANGPTRRLLTRRFVNGPKVDAPPRTMKNNERLIVTMKWLLVWGPIRPVPTLLLPCRSA